MPTDAKHEVGQGADQQRRVVESGHHVKIGDAQRFRLLASFDIDLVKGFDVLGEEGNRDSPASA